MPGPGGHRIGLVDVLELAREVVAGRDHATFGHRLARQPLADPQPLRTDEVALLVGQPRVVGRDEDALVGVELVDDRAVGPEQATRLVDDPLEQVARLADRGDPGGDLAERPLGLGTSFDDRRASGPAPRSGARCGSRSRPGWRGRSGPRRRRRRRRPAGATRPTASRAARHHRSSGTAITDRIPNSRTNSRAGSSRRNRSSTR